MSPSLIENILRTAQKSVIAATREGNVSELVSLINRLTKTDLGLHKSQKLNEDRSDIPFDRARIIYIDIYKCFEFSAGIFIVSKGSRVPLHNHPGMYGFLKCLSGRLVVESFTPLSTSRHPSSKLIPTTAHGKLIIDESSPVCQVAPICQNIHEITSFGEETAAFFDLLSPPYNYPQDDDEACADWGYRDCTYYRNLGSNINVDPHVTWLEVLDSTPPDYICQGEKYMGPRLSL